MIRTTFLLVLGLVFVGGALIGASYVIVLQNSELSSVQAGIPGMIFPLPTTIPMDTAIPTDTLPPGDPTSTPQPTRTPTLRPTFTASPTEETFSNLIYCVNSLSANTINVRSGPGTIYAPIGEPLLVGKCLAFSARNEEETWLQVAPAQLDPTLRQYEGGWIFRELLGLGTTGPIDLPAVTLTPTPIPGRAAITIPAFALAPALTRTETPSPSLSFKSISIPVIVTRSPSRTPPSGHTASSSHQMVEVEWPSRLETGHSGRLRVSLIRTSQGYVPTVEISGNTVAFTPIPVGTPGQEPGVAFGDEYEASAAIAHLVGTPFEISRASSEYQLLDKPRIDWIWSIASDNPGVQGLEVYMEVELKRIDNADERVKHEVWRSHLMIKVVRPLITSGQVSIFSLVSGFLGSGLSIPWIYENLKKRKPEQRRKAKKRR